MPAFRNFAALAVAARSAFAQLDGLLDVLPVGDVLGNAAGGGAADATDILSAPAVLPAPTVVSETTLFGIDGRPLVTLTYSEIVTGLPTGGAIDDYYYDDANPADYPTDYPIDYPIDVPTDYPTTYDAAPIPTPYSYGQHAPSKPVYDIPEYSTTTTTQQRKPSTTPIAEYYPSSRVPVYSASVPSRPVYSPPSYQPETPKYATTEEKKYATTEEKKYATTEEKKYPTTSTALVYHTVSTAAAYPAQYGKRAVQYGGQPQEYPSYKQETSSVVQYPATNVTTVPLPPAQPTTAPVNYPSTTGIVTASKPAPPASYPVQSYASTGVMPKPSETPYHPEIYTGAASIASSSAFAAIIGCVAAFMRL